MPNHLHGIIEITDLDNPASVPVGAGLAPALNGANGRVKTNASFGATARVAPTVGRIIGTFKSLTTNEWLNYIKQNNLNLRGKFWQRNYYEHIISNEQDYNNIVEYIRNNPLMWERDRNNGD